MLTYGRATTTTPLDRLLGGWMIHWMVVVRECHRLWICGVSGGRLVALCVIFCVIMPSG